MNRDFITIVGGIGGLIFLGLLFKHADAFNSITKQTASSASTLITTLAGQ